MLRLRSAWQIGYTDFIPLGLQPLPLACKGESLDSKSSSTRWRGDGVRRTEGSGLKNNQNKTVPLREEGQRGGALLATTGALAPQRSADRPAKRREFKKQTSYSIFRCFDFAQHDILDTQTLSPSACSHSPLHAKGRAWNGMNKYAREWVIAQNPYYWP